PHHVAAAERQAMLRGLGDQSTWLMTDDETRSTLCELTRPADPVAELGLALRSPTNPSLELRRGDEPRRCLALPHHRRARDTRYDMTYLPQGKVGFHRRT
ncbi:MAG: hypothetical protein M3237_09200, partial [Actinomycetota bacterium]|nr:hypothetical protein [Actinomycetota bacterium]